MEKNVIKKLKEAFDISGNVKQLPGGQGEAFRIGDLVFKPVDDEDTYSKFVEMLSNLKPRGYKLPVHVKSINGNYCELGFCATFFVQGTESGGRLKEKLSISTLYHKDMAEFDTSTLLLERHRWESANSVLWRGRPLPENWIGKRKEICRYILENLDEVKEPYQIIHGDLNGNIIFNDDGLPTVIDFSPTVAPKKYADAIIVCDAIAWDNQPMESLKLLAPFEEYRKFVKYAVAFRILTTAFSDKFIKDDFFIEWEAYKPIWNIAMKLS